LTQRDRAASLVLGTAATVTVRLPRRWTANSTLFCLSVALIAGGGIVFDRYDHQYQTELPERRPRVTRFTVGIGHCADCARRVQGRHPEQTSDALGAAGSHLGPNARGFGHWLHYVLGLSFAKAASVLARLGVPVIAGALSSGAQSTARALV
jgi:hypothetical protein